MTEVTKPARDYLRGIFAEVHDMAGVARPYIEYRRNGRSLRRPFYSPGDAARLGSFVQSNTSLFEEHHAAFANRFDATIVRSPIENLFTPPARVIRILSALADAERQLGIDDDRSKGVHIHELAELALMRPRPVSRVVGFIDQIEGANGWPISLYVRLTDAPDTGRQQGLKTPVQARRPILMPGILPAY